ncbi:hypothetical protein LCI18_003761 [Fusarium solani-melongenae]|uniref:Uncharacterized protein n=1 Tax=Fusarium solani subsp. cucurbitae TaxID=2747967 RepID=A0ACD3YW42_FUSSC|nr:hypothetical protein LCI18_003761 [Fusarium solani-melongenae]
MPKYAPTTTIRDDHKYWKCKQSFICGTTCNTTNRLSDKQCPACGSKRDALDEALDGYLRKIGTLFKTDTDGKEWWEYDS